MLKKVLVVDDEEIMCSIISRELGRLNWNTSWTTNPTKVIQMLDCNQPYDLVITDYMMPGMTGVELSEQIVKRFPKTKVIIVSGSDVPNTYSDNVIASIEKPFEIDDINNMMLEAFAN